MQSLLFLAEALHAKGYENLKVVPSLSPSGLYWRCSFVTSETNREFDVIVSSWLQNYYAVSVEQVELNIKELTDKFIEDHKDFLAKCIGRNTEYVTWFQDVLELLKKEELPYAFSDYFGPTTYWETSLGKKIYLNPKEAIKYSSDSNNNFDYREIEDVIKSFYKDNGYGKDLKNDLVYLQSSFDEIKTLWLRNLDKIEKVNYIMIAEAPLWGGKKKYIYNPSTSLSQFFFKSDLEEVLRIAIEDKTDFIKICNSIGLLIIDISPYPLNEKDTRINYRSIGKSNYKKIVDAIYHSILIRKYNLLNPNYLIIQKCFSDINV